MVSFRAGTDSPQSPARGFSYWQEQRNAWADLCIYRRLLCDLSQVICHLCASVAYWGCKGWQVVTFPKCFVKSCLGQNKSKTGQVWWSCSPPRLQSEILKSWGRRPPVDTTATPLPFSEFHQRQTKPSYLLQIGWAWIAF